jgi:hypothetical protein
MANGAMMTRRQFLKLGAMAAAACAVGIDAIGDAYAEVKSFCSKRLASVYARDAAMAVRKSQENPLIAQLYAEFLEHPLSEKSERLLHTQYVSRGNTIAQVRAMGIELPVQ